MSLPDTGQDAAALQSAAAQMGCAIDLVVAGQILHYRDMLVRWNRVYNLTAVRDPPDMWAQHLLDSLSIIAPLERHANGGNLRLLDVGSGGGLPGVVIAIARPSWQVISVDAVAKKASFVRQVGLELPLQNLQAIHGRVESLAPQAVDIVVSRAFASLADFARWTRSHLDASGVWLAMKGKRPDQELADLAPSEVQVFHVEPLSVPGLQAERHLIWMRPA